MSYNEITSVMTSDKGGNTVPYDLQPIIESATVISVNQDDWVVELKSDFVGRHPTKVEIPGLGTSPTGGMGGYFPQVGDKVLVTWPSDRPTVPQILCFLPTPNHLNGMRGMRPKMTSGDYIFATEDGNRVAIRRGGVTEVRANAITQRLYVPILNQIKDFCENYLMNTAGGVLKWINRRDDKSNGSSPVELVWEIKEKTDEDVLLVLRMGAVSGVTDMPDDSLDHKEVLEGGDVVFRATVDKSGNMKVQAAEFLANITGNAEVNVAGDTNVNVTGNMDVLFSHLRIGTEAGLLNKAVKGDLLQTAFNTYLDSYLQNLLTALNTIMQALYGAVTAPTIPVGTPGGPDPVYAALKVALEATKSSWNSAFSAEQAGVTLLKTNIDLSLSRDVDLT